MRPRPAASELLAWMLVGAGLGVVAGFALSQWMGAGAPEDGSPSRPDPPVAPLRARAATRAVRLALQQDPALAGYELEPVAVGAGVVELHGWVATRSLRGRAARVAGAAPGITSLINCLLVHGEDDPVEPDGSPSRPRA
jgi:hypothetical protein